MPSGHPARELCACTDRSDGICGLPGRIWEATPTVDVANRFVQWRAQSGDGNRLGVGDWARVTFNATTPAATPAAGADDWTIVVNNSQGGPCTGSGQSQTKLQAVWITNTPTQTYTATFRDAAGNLITPVAAAPGTETTYRVRITRTGGTKNLESAVIALPHCFTNSVSVPTMVQVGPTSQDKSNQWVGAASGFDHAAPDRVDNVIRLRNIGDALSSSGQYVTVEFKATAPAFVVGPPPTGCAVGTYTFLTAATEGKAYNSNADVSKIFAISGAHPTVVVSANVAPVCVNDSGSTPEDTQLGDSVVCTDANGNPLTYSVVSTTTNGVLTFNTNGSFTYDPIANFNGSDSFTFKANDGTVDSNTVTYSITVTNVNDDPVAVNDAATVAEDSGANAIDVLANDHDGVDSGETLTVTAVTQGTSGSVTFTATGVSYTPNANFFGSDSFTYTISDGNGGTATATVNVTVTNVNDDPVAVNDAATVAEDSGANAIDVLANDHDGADTGETLTVTAVTQGTSGSVTFTATGVSYTPNANFFGSDSFTYTISDGNGGERTRRPST